MLIAAGLAFCAAIGWLLLVLPGVLYRAYRQQQSARNARAPMRSESVDVNA